MSKDRILEELKQIIKDLDENEYRMGGYAMLLQDIYYDIDAQWEIEQ